ncbi:MAG: hypothetical protein NTV23_01635 [Propionibacteriales bacterium]|nr:hypothetical protein [Propionibacteriales bacterium]
MPTQLPYVDTHAVTVPAAPEQVWDAVTRYAEQVGFGGPSLFQRALATVPVRGFEVTDQDAGTRLVLSGRHRFSVYQLSFTLESPGNGQTTTLHATTRAAFPGVSGRLYRALVIGTGLHVIATRLMLRAIGRAGVSDGD